MAKKESSFNVAQDLFSGEPQTENKGSYKGKPVLIEQRKPEIIPKETTSITESKVVLEKLPKETKSKRISLLAQPSLIDNLQAIAVMKKVSLNELIVTEMKKVADQNADLVEKYKTFFRE